VSVRESVQKWVSVAFLFGKRSSWSHHSTHFFLDKNSICPFFRRFFFWVSYWLWLYFMWMILSHLGMVMERGGDEFYLPLPILYSQILTHYPTHIKWGWEIESHSHPRRVQVSPPHPHHCNGCFFNKKRSIC